MSSSDELRRLAGILPPRPSLSEIRLEGVDPFTHPVERANQAGETRELSGKAKEHADEYFRKSGEAHHAGQVAHQVTAMIKSGELSGSGVQHGNAAAAHKQAQELHRGAAAAAGKAGAGWMDSYHQGEGSKHEKHARAHEKHAAK